MNKATQYKNLVEFRYGFNFVVSPLETRILGGGRRDLERIERDERDGLIWSKLGRGE